MYQKSGLFEDLRVGDFVLESEDRCSSLCLEGNSGCGCDISATCRCGTHTGQYECICPSGWYGTGLRGGCQRKYVNVKKGLNCHGITDFALIVTH